MLQLFPIKSLLAQIHGYLIQHCSIIYIIQTVSVSNPWINHQSDFWVSVIFKRKYGSPFFYI